MLDQLYSIVYSHDASWNVPAVRKQIIAIHALMNAMTDDRDQKLSLLRFWFQRDFHSSNDLTKAEADAVITLGFGSHDSFKAFVEESKQYVYEF